MSRRRLIPAPWPAAVAIAVALLVLGWWAGPRPAAHANGVPQLVKLTYLESISNWGPAEAEGVLEFSFAEGFLSLEAVGLPRLVGQAYEGWLVRSNTNEAISVGRFNAAADGTVQYEAQLPPITDYSLDLFMITVQSLSDPEGQTSQLRSIGGFFSVIQPPEAGSGGVAETDLANAGSDGGGLGSAGTGAADTAEGGPAAGEADRPALLPETGDSESFLAGIRGLALAVGGALALLWVVARTRQRLAKGSGS